ncbi:MAG: ABC transporter ATP-binding protein [Elusimicrobiota bacterium]
MIEVSSLVKVYGEGGRRFRALRGVSFRLRKGEFAAVMGPSGCGKSTLLNILGLMDPPTSGTYRLGALRVDGLGDSQRTMIRRTKLGFVFQAFNLLPRLTALQNVCLPMSYAGMGMAERLERGRMLLDRVGLAARAAQTPIELSGGERQRVGIARALANRPRLLLADEPTGNLDSQTSGEILDLFGELHAEGMTVLVVTHDRGIADRAERVLHIMDGKLVKEERNGENDL